MRLYTLSVRSDDFPSYCDPLKFKSDSMEEVMSIIDLMLKNGHSVSVESEEKEPAEPSDELVEAVARRLADRTAEDTEPAPFTLDEVGTEAVTALAG